MEPSYFDGIDNVFIHFDDKDGLFEGGQKLSGKINILVKETTRIRDIKLYVTGRLRIKWIDVEGGANVNFEELDFPINETIIIHEMNRNDEYSKWLFPGNKTFRFSYPLEKTLPYSLEGKYGTIAYKAKAVVMIANGKTSESMEEDFFVRSRPPQLEENLLTIASLKAPLDNVEYGKVGSGCFSTAKRNIEIGIKIPKPIFKQGEKVYISACTIKSFFFKKLDSIMVRLLVHGYNLTAIRVYFIFFDLSLPDNHVLMIYSTNKHYLFLDTLNIVGRN